MSAPASLQFLGAAGTVTGSKYLITHGQHAVLLDCGLFQGLKALRLRNWAEPPVDARRIQAVVLSHAHIDHCGYLPVLVRRGFAGRVLCTSGTADLLQIMLIDSAKLQEEDAASANQGGYSKHHPALPLYTTDDAQAALRLVVPHPYGRAVPVAPGIDAIFRRAGHIIGAATVELQVGLPNPVKVVFSGDLGRWDQPILRDPEFVPEADYLLLESTYGDTRHAADPATTLARVVHDAVKRGGALIIPAFAVGRTQHLTWLLRELEAQGRIPALPVYIDSPMAAEASAVYARHHEDHDEQMRAIAHRARAASFARPFHLVATIEQSKALNRMPGPLIIISSSGMVTGGRVLHHLRLRLPDPATTVLLTGYQADGTRGRSLQGGATSVKMLGEVVPVRAHIDTIDGLSAHADQPDLLRWLGGFTAPPRMTYLVHGEAGPCRALADVIERQLRWRVAAAADGQTVPLTRTV